MKLRNKLLTLALALVLILGSWTSLVLAEEPAPAQPAGTGNILITIKYVYADDEDREAADTDYRQIQPGYEGEVTIDSPSVVGYTPDQRTVTIKYEDFTEDTVLTVKYYPNTVKYEILHFLQNVNQTDYELYETVEKEAKVDSEVTAEPKAYPGFTPITPYQSEKIPAEGTLQLRVEYKRNQYTLTYDTDGGSDIPAQQRFLMNP